MVKIVCPDGKPHNTKVLADDGTELQTKFPITKIEITIDANEMMATAKLYVPLPFIEVACKVVGIEPSPDLPGQWCVPCNRKVVGGLTEEHMTSAEHQTNREKPDGWWEGSSD